MVTFSKGGVTSDGNRSSGFYPCLGEVYLVSRRFADQHLLFLDELAKIAATPDPEVRRQSLTRHWSAFVGQETKRLASLESERRAAVRREKERIEQERVARIEAEKARAEQERQEAERREAARLEAASLEAARLEAERLEAERLAKLEAERLEQERLQKERLEEEQLAKAAAEKEKQRLAAEKRRQELAKQERARKEAAKKAQTAGLPIVQELDLLGKLLKSGHLSQPEYDRRKQAVLDRRFGEVVTAAGATGDAMPFAEGVTFGDYHALIIGINDYRHIRKLRTAENDARQIAGVLSKQYGFKTTLMLNPTRAQIIDRLDLLREQLKFKDNLVIYYAGHGWLDQVTDEGYWMPVDAKPNRRSNWISNAVVTNSLRAIKAKHVMLLADSCFAGRLTRGIGVHLGVADYYQKMTRKKARVVITSGGLEPVDDGRGGHSPFAAALLRTLRTNQGILDGTRLFDAIRRSVMTAAEQTPEYSDVRKAGHDGGDFIFVKRN